MEGDYVLVVGSSVLEMAGRSIEVPQPGTRQQGHIHASASGVARNIAENLARLDIDTILLSAVADDELSEYLVSHSRLAGIDCSHVMRVTGERTAASLLLYQSAENVTRLDDLSITAALDSDYLLEHEWLFQDAALVVIDATLSEDALDTLFELAQRHKARVCADPTSPGLARRLRKYIPNLFLIVPNASETAALCSLDEPSTERESAIGTAQRLVNMGATIAVVTLGERGLAYADRSGGGYIRALHTEVVDTSGAGDAFSGAAIFGILNGVPIDEAMRLGVAAASLTLQSEDTVLRSLNPDLLYDELGI
ncbi:MAG: PfkB family carbohydrate kinase [Chloroflexi bacterium]|nr:PfkB family carbohydrate kinase [Chloroflexota bacterium]